MTDKQKKMVEDNHNLIYTFLNKYHLTIDEWYDLAAIGLCKAATTFNEELSVFSTYAFRCMFTAVFQEKRKETLERRIPQNMIFYYQAEINTGNDSDAISFIDIMPTRDDVEGEAVSKMIFEKFVHSLKPRDKVILQMFCGGYTQKEIGKMVGCSQGHISRIKSNFEQYLTKKGGMTY